MAAKLAHTRQIGLFATSQAEEVTAPRLSTTQVEMFELPSVTPVTATQPQAPERSKRRRPRPPPRPRGNQDPDAPENADDPGPYRNSVTARNSLVVGVTRFAWLFKKSRDWAEARLREWYEEQQAGTGPVRVFKQGARGSLYTTMGAIHQWMPPGRDVEVYRRLKDVEEEIDCMARRIDREVIERKMTVAREIAECRRGLSREAVERKTSMSELTARVALLESRRKSG